jgi:amino acid permease
MAVESLLLGVALIVLVIQLAVLTNLIQNDLKPILSSTKETVSTLKGTSKFISERAVKPIISVSSFMAVHGNCLKLLGLLREKNRLISEGGRTKCQTIQMILEHF